MILHENPKLFQQAVQFTAQQMNIAEIYVEKDYWVTIASREPQYIINKNVWK